MAQPWISEPREYAIDPDFDPFDLYLYLPTMDAPPATNEIDARMRRSAQEYLRMRRDMRDYTPS